MTNESEFHLQFQPKFWDENVAPWITMSAHENRAKSLDLKVCALLKANPDFRFRIVEVNVVS
jgi:hypothetical protein